MELVHQITAQIRTADAKHFGDGHAAARCRKVEHRLQQERRVIPGDSSVELTPHFEFEVVELRAPILIGHFVFEQQPCATSQSFRCGGVVVAHLEYKEKDAAAPRVICRQCCVGQQHL